MPELPEVETIARGLRHKVLRRRIAAIEVAWQRSIDQRGVSEQVLVGDVISDVHRLGKFVILSLESGRSVAIHLRMTGRLIVDPPAADPHTRLTLRFEDGGVLVFSDARKFGRWRVIEGDPSRALRIGIDPFDPALSASVFAGLVRKRATPIKTWLLDQRFLSGIGNIYACEALFAARIRPRRRARSLSVSERAQLLASLRKVMRKAIQHRGSSVDDYLDAEGMPGGFQKQLAVYGRGGLPCRRCRTPIRRVVLAQRGTFYCPTCQQ
jgi:formamidopyrimidine-DNA glycosylase